MTSRFALRIATGERRGEAVLRGPVHLVNRDRIRLGDHVFSFEIVPDTEGARPNVTKVFTDPTTEVIGTRGNRVRARLVTHLATGHRGKEYSIGGRAIVLGRGKGTHNFMADSDISPRHAKIAPEPGGGFVLTDLDSATGTWHQTRERVTLEPGQELLIGRQRLEVAQQA
ncbi:MAG: FHA domain-containing protein [Planctomycetes bacterium]|nr:FHA domain-containing protein [Planctomycetota bacterium]